LKHQDLKFRWNRAESDGSIGLNLELGITFLDVYIFFSRVIKSTDKSSASDLRNSVQVHTSIHLMRMYCSIR